MQEQDDRPVSRSSVDVVHAQAAEVVIRQFHVVWFESKFRQVRQNVRPECEGCLSLILFYLGAN